MKNIIFEFREKVMVSRLTKCVAVAILIHSISLEVFSADTAPAVKANAGAEAKTKFGAAVGNSGVLNFDTVLTHPKENMSKPIITEVTVSKVCKAKGCWMEVKGADKSARVTFKNYGFFVPANILDKKIRIQGMLTEKTMSIKEQRHYLEDEGRSKEDIAAVKEPKFVYEFVADGVEMLD